MVHIVTPDYPYHIVQRENLRQQTFFIDPEIINHGGMEKKIFVAVDKRRFKNIEYRNQYETNPVNPSTMWSLG